MNPMDWINQKYGEMSPYLIDVHKSKIDSFIHQFYSWIFQIWCCQVWKKIELFSAICIISR